MATLAVFQETPSYGFYLESPVWEIIMFKHKSQQDNKVTPTGANFFVQKKSPKPNEIAMKVRYYPAERAFGQSIPSSDGRRHWARGIDSGTKGVSFNALLDLKGRTVTVYHGGVGWGSFMLIGVDFDEKDFDEFEVRYNSNLGQQVPSYLEIDLRLLQVAVSNPIYPTYS